MMEAATEWVESCCSIAELDTLAGCIAQRREKLLHGESQEPCTPSSPTKATSITVKLKCGAELWRWSMDRGAIRIDTLLGAIHERIDGENAVKWQDEDGDLINLLTQSDLDESLGQCQGLLRLFCTQRTAVSPREASALAARLETAEARTLSAESDVHTLQQRILKMLKYRQSAQQRDGLKASGEEEVARRQLQLRVLQLEGERSGLLSERLTLVSSLAR